MKRGLEGVLLLVLSCFAVCAVCGCGSLERKFTTVEAEVETDTKLMPADLGRYWYGYWYLTDAEGDWGRLDGYSWDCCGELSSEADDQSLLLWDEDMPKDYYLARIDFQFSDGEYICTGGEFLDISLNRGAAAIKLEENEGQFLEISGVYSDETTGNFYYVICLRPWGDEWPQGKSRPYYYERWYLPKIEAGEDPPDAIEPYE